MFLDVFSKILNNTWKYFWINKSFMKIGMLWNFSKNLGNTFIHKIFQKSFLAFLEIINNNKEKNSKMNIFRIAMSGNIIQVTKVIFNEGLI